MVAAIDFETNGFSPKKESVLSFGVVFEDGTKVERFYFPKEDYNDSAIKVNGLTRDVIIEKRGDADYPIYFSDDHDFLSKILENVKTLVAHNMSFDYRWLPDEVRNRFPQQIGTHCTMKEGKIDGKRANLKKVAECNGIDVLDEGLHDGLYDAALALEIYKKQVENNG